MTDPKLQSELAKLTPDDAAKVKRLLDIAAKSSAEMTGPELREAREAAGLTLAQAAQLLGIRVGVRPLANVEKMNDPLLTLAEVKSFNHVYRLNLANAGECK